MSDITRSESIKQLHRLKADINNGLAFVSKTKDKHLALESLDMAIESLKTDEAYQLEYEQPEFCVDCISRKRAIISITACDGKSAQIEALEKLPSVYPENTVSLSAYKQAAWERDIAIQQLHELGYEFGQKIEPTTKNDLGDDAVSRKNVHDMLENLPVTVEDKWFNWLQKACMRLAELPSVTPQPRKGHWINKDYLFNSCSAECSSCHKRSNGYQHDNGFSLDFKYYDFCPNCGSDNREVENE